MKSTTSEGTLNPHNRKSKHSLKTISSLLLMAFLFNEAVYSAPADGLSSLLPKSVPSVQIADHLGRVSGQFQGSGERFLIHIQDAHTNTGAQKNIAKILEHLVSQYGIDTVFIEGGTRDDSLTFLKPLASQSLREQVGKKYLLRGEMNGAEYFSLTGEKDIRLLGVEDKALYDKSLADYADVFRKRESVLSYIGEMEGRLSSLKRKMYPKSILELDDFLTAFKNKQKDFTEYYELLSSLADKAQINLLGFPNFLSLKNLKTLEDSVDFKAAQAEQETLMKTLLESESPESEELSDYYEEHLEKIKSGRTNQTPFYESLLSRATSMGLDMKNFSNLSAYTAYLKAYQSVRMERLLSELNTLEDIVYMKSLEDEDAFYLYRAARHVATLRTLFSMQATRDEFDGYVLSKADARFSIRVILAFINRKLYDRGRYADVVKTSKVIEDNVESVESFYRATLDRDRVFMDKALGRMREDNLKAAVLITGGYHTDNLKNLMKDEDVSYLVVSPVVTQETNIARYEEILFSPLGEKSPFSSSKKVVNGTKQHQITPVALVERPGTSVALLGGLGVPADLNLSLAAARLVASPSVKELPKVNLDVVKSLRVNHGLSENPKKNGDEQVDIASFKRTLFRDPRRKKEESWQAPNQIQIYVMLEDGTVKAIEIDKGVGQEQVSKKIEELIGGSEGDFYLQRAGTDGVNYTIYILESVALALARNRESILRSQAAVAAARMAGKKWSTVDGGGSKDWEKALQIRLEDLPKLITDGRLVRIDGNQGEWQVGSHEPWFARIIEAEEGTFKVELVVPKWRENIVRPRIDYDVQSLKSGNIRLADEYDVMSSRVLQALVLSGIYGGIYADFSKKIGNLDLSDRKPGALEEARVSVERFERARQNRIDGNFDVESLSQLERWTLGKLLGMDGWQNKSDKGIRDYLTKYKVKVARKVNQFLDENGSIPQSVVDGMFNTPRHSKFPKGLSRDDIEIFKMAIAVVERVLADNLENNKLKPLDGKAIAGLFSDVMKDEGVVPVGDIPLTLPQVARMAEDTESTNLLDQVVSLKGMSLGERLAYLRRLKERLETERGSDKPNPGNFITEVTISDEHGSIDKMLAFILYSLKKVFPENEVLQKLDKFERGELMPQLTKIGLTKEMLRARIFFHNLGDFGDRGEYGSAVALLSQELVENDLSDVVFGNHDHLPFMALLGLHLPHYQGFNLDFNGYFKKETDLLQRLSITQLPLGEIIQNFNSELIPDQPSVAGESDQEAKTMNAWNRIFIEENNHQDSLQKSKWKKIDHYFSGSDEKRKRGLNEDVDKNKMTPDQKKLWDKFTGFNSEGVSVYTGIHAVGKMSPIWWQELLLDFETHRRGLSDIELGAWDKAIEAMRDGIRIDGQDLPPIVEFVTNDFQERVTKLPARRAVYIIFYQNYSTAEWAAWDWGIHPDWGTAFFKELSKGAPSMPIINEENYLQHPTLIRIKEFIKTRFNLYLQSAYMDVQAHAFLPIESYDLSEEGKILGQMFFVHEGVEYRGVGDQQGRFKSVWEGLDLLAKEIRDAKNVGEMLPALKTIYTWYADNSTRIKPSYEIGFYGDTKAHENFLEVNGIPGNFSRGHNPLSAFKKYNSSQLGAFSGFFSEVLNREGQKRGIVNVDGGMSGKFGNQGIISFLNPATGLQVFGYEPGGESIIPNPEIEQFQNRGLERGEYLPSLISAVDEEIARVTGVLEFLDRVSTSPSGARLVAESESVVDPSLATSPVVGLRIPEIFPTATTTFDGNLSAFVDTAAVQIGHGIQSSLASGGATTEVAFLASASFQDTTRAELKVADFFFTLNETGVMTVSVTQANVTTASSFEVSSRLFASLRRGVPMDLVLKASAAEWLVSQSPAWVNNGAAWETLLNASLSEGVKTVHLAVPASILTHSIDADRTLDQLEQLARAKGLEIVVTVLDGEKYGSPLNSHEKSFFARGDGSLVTITYTTVSEGQTAYLAVMQGITDDKFLEGLGTGSAKLAILTPTGDPDTISGQTDAIPQNYRPNVLLAGANMADLANANANFFLGGMSRVMLGQLLGLSSNMTEASELFNFSFESTPSGTVLIFRFNFDSALNAARLASQAEMYA